jgi:hypothetical protein
MKKMFKTVMVNNSTKINKAENFLLAQTSEQKKTML